MKKYNTFTAYDSDEFGLPVFQTDTALELSVLLGVSVRHLLYCIQNFLICSGFEVRGDAIMD